MRRSHSICLFVLFAVLAFVSTVRAKQYNADYNAGQAAYDRSDWDGVITNFTKAIAVGFNLYDSYSCRAYAESQKGQSNAAIADCNEVIRIDPAGYFWRSRVELELTNISAAVADFKMGKTLRPQMSEDELATDLALYYLQECYRFYFKMGDVPAALTNCSLAVSIDPNHEGACTWLAWLEELSGRHARALMDADTAIELGQAHEETNIITMAYITRAFARVECNLPAGALDDCRQVIAQNQKGLLHNSKLEGWLPGMEGGHNGEMLEAEGLEAFMNGDNQAAIQAWKQSWEESNKYWKVMNDSNHGTATNDLPVMKSYLDLWIAKAQEKLKEKSPATNSTSIQPATMAK